MAQQRVARSERRTELIRLHAALTWLLETSAALLPAGNLEETLDQYLGRLLDLLGAQQGSIMLRQADELVVVARRGLSSEVTPGMKVHLTDGPAGEVAASGVPRLLSEPLPSRRTHPRPTSAMIVPLRARDGIIGVLNIGKVARACAFTAEELQTTSVLALQLAWILSNFAHADAGAYGRAGTDSTGLLTRMAQVIASQGTLTPQESAEFGGALADLAERIEQAVEVLRQLTGFASPEAAYRDLRLTPRELEILSHLGDGRSNAEIARQCWISENTVKFHMKNLFTKLNVRDRGQAVMIARAMRQRLPSSQSASTPNLQGSLSPARALKSLARSRA